VLTELIKVPDLLKILEKSDTSLKWKMIEEVFERRKNESRFVEEKGKIFPNLTRIIILETTAAFVAYKNTQINPTMAILAKTILTLNHCRRVGKGSMICFE
jgi:repressor of nif and glnA expression